MDEKSMIGSCKVMINGKELGWSGNVQHVNIAPLSREMSVTLKISQDAESFWMMRLMAIGGCRNPRGLQ